MVGFRQICEMSLQSLQEFVIEQFRTGCLSTVFK